MKTGDVQANLCVLNQSTKLSYLDELVDRKRTGAEKGAIESADVEFYRIEYERLSHELERSYEESKLPEMPTGRAALNDVLVRLRLRDGGVSARHGLTEQAPD